MRGAQKGMEFLTGYLIEYSLSVDNIFVFVMLFRFFAVPSAYQHRVLFWGILAAVVLRGAMIALGVTLIQRFEWILYVFGAFLLFTGVKMFAHHGIELHPEANPALRLCRRFLPLTPQFEGTRFLVRRDGRWLFTPLFLVLVAVEGADVVFAVDSIPAIFGITTDPFIVYTSNICAILGLRSLYFLLAGVMGLFKYLQHGLALVLVFIGGKMLLSHWVHIDTRLSLAVVAAILAASVLLSIAHRSERSEAPP
jgi:tellurite resistance protein TerC